MTARDWVALLRRQALLVLAVVVLVPVGTFAFASLQHNEYESTAEVLLSDDSGLLTGGNVAQVPIALANEVTLAQSTSVRDLARRAMPDVGAVTVAQAQTSTALDFTATARTPVLAQQTVSAYVSAYLQARQAQADRSLAAIRGTIQRQLSALSTQIAGVQRSIAGSKGDTSGLAASRDSLLQQRTALATRLGDLQLGGGTVAGFIHVVSAPSLPQHPTSPTPGRDAAIGFVLGLLLALGLAFLVDRSGLLRRQKRAHRPSSVYEAPAAAPLQERQASSELVSHWFDQSPTGPY